MFSRKKACKGKLKGIVRKESQSFTNHGHAKTPPTVFSPLSLWLTLPRDMGVSHALWPPGITRAILACLWFAQGLYRAPKIKTTESFLRACGLHNMMFRVILCVFKNNGISMAFDIIQLRITPPSRLSEKSRRELKSMYPTTGATTNFQSSLGILLFLRQSSSLGK